MIKNILFDFGNVLYDIDFKLTTTAFEKLGFQQPEQMFSQHVAGDIFQQLEKGLITPAVFYEGLRQYTAEPVTDTQLQNAWNALLIGYRTSSLDFLPGLAGNYKLFLLSNTNIIHYNYFAPQLGHTTPYNSLENFFTKAYFSHEIHLRKPDKEVYEFVLNDAGIEAEETLFIDDTHTNFPQAELLGIHTHLLQPGERVEQLNWKE